MPPKLYSGHRPGFWGYLDLAYYGTTRMLAFFSVPKYVA